MTDRHATLQWLIQQARDHDGEGPHALHAPDITKAKAAECLRTGEVVLSEDLAWELATGAITEWFLPRFPELQELDVYEKVNLLRLSVELSLNGRQRNSSWLALATHRWCCRVDVGLGESDLPRLIERLSFCPPLETALTNIDVTLAHLNSIIESVGIDRRKIAAALAVSAVYSWMHYPNESPAIQSAVGSDQSAFSKMLTWVLGHANQVIFDKSVSEHVHIEAYRAACSCARVVVFQELRDGKLSAPFVSSRFEEYLLEVKVPEITHPGFAYLPESDFRKHLWFLIILSAEWLVESGSPSAAIDQISRAAANNSEAYEQEKDSIQTAICRASALARLGLIQQAVKELEVHSEALEGVDAWSMGRVCIETGDDRGLGFLRSAVALPDEIGFSESRARMRLLLAEKEVEIGDPARAIALAESMMDKEVPWISTHARVILAEAHITLAKAHENEKEFYLDRAKEVLAQLNPSRIVDTPDRIRPRAQAAEGEIHVLNGELHEARQLFRNAMSQLEDTPPVSWATGSDGVFALLSPDDTPGRYWRRPWEHSWLHSAELGLMAELSGEVDPKFAFDQLQRYRSITHTGTIAELAGFTPESALAAGKREKQEELSRQVRQLRFQENSLPEEHRRVREAIWDIRANESQKGKSRQDLKRLRERSSQISRDLQKARNALVVAEAEIERIQTEIEETRGYLSKPNGIQRPEIEELRRILAEEDAAVLELVRVDGTLWGQPVRWHGFTVTADVGVTHVELPSAEIDRELGRLRGDRTRLQKHALGKLSDFILARLPKQLFLHTNLFIASDGDAWAIPFRSLLRRRWMFVPWKFTDESTYSNWPIPDFLKRFMDSLAPRMDVGVVSNVISTSHLIRLLQRSPQRDEYQRTGVVVGSSSNSKERILCEGLATSLELHPPKGVKGTRWRKYPGNLQACTPLGGDRPEWLEGTSQLFVGSWHTTFSSDPTTVATFHFDDSEMSLAEFLSQSRHRSNIAVILSCNISLPSSEDTCLAAGRDRTFCRLGSAAFGISEALQAEAIVATTNEVTAEVAFVLGRFLATELATGADVHTALAASQRRLRQCTVAEVINMLEKMEQDVPEISDWLCVLRSRKRRKKAFPNRYDTEPFYILGLPTAKLGSGQL